MNEKDPIEEALQAMRPADIPAHLMARLTAARPRPAADDAPGPWRTLLLRWLLPIAASASVAVATFYWLERTRSDDQTSPAPIATGDPQLPVENEHYFVAARPVGTLVAPNQRPYRLMEVEWLEHETEQPAGGGPARHTATMRRDVIPVALELY